jgi:hypothetical protein
MCIRYHNFPPLNTTLYLSWCLISNDICCIYAEFHHRIAQMLWQNILAVLRLTKLCIQYCCPTGILLSRENLRYASFITQLSG